LARIKFEVIVRKKLDSHVKAARVATKVSAALKRGALRIERKAKRKVPSAFGLLRTSIASQGPFLEKTAHGAVILWKVTVGKLWGKFIEFGTGPSGKKSQLSKTARAAMKEMGYKHGPGGKMPPLKEIARWMKRRRIDPKLLWPIARAIGKRGIKAQPFLYPAYDEEKERILKDVADSTKSALEA